MNWKNKLRLPGREFARRLSLILLTASVLTMGACQGRCARRTTPSSLPAAPQHNEPAPASYADIVGRVAPAVVTVRSERIVRAPRQFPFFNDPFFRDFFDGNAPQPRDQIQRGLGSGVLVTADGYILTNHHVIDGAEDIKVELADNRVFNAKVVGSDPPSDLAVLKIDAGNLPVLTLGDSDKTRVGDVVLAVGNPLNLGQTVTAGILSAKGRATGLSEGSFESFLQTDAPINKGNSGGALVNTWSELIGINSQILSPTGGNIGIGFAIPSNMARTVMDQLVKGGKVRRGKLGVTIQPVTSDIAASLGLKEAHGVIINSVEQGGPADQAGLQRGDVILSFNGTAVNDANTLRNLVAGVSPGTDVTLSVSRDGKEQQMHVKLSELTSESAQSPTSENRSNGEGGKFGLNVTPLTPDLAAQVGVPRDVQGVVVTAVDSVGPAAETGLQAGDVIQQVDRQPVRSAQELQAALNSAGNRPALLLVNRRGNNLFLTLRR